MKPEAQRIAIAEACGWKWFQKGHPEHDVHWQSPQGDYTNLPNYLNDLNAMHEAEETLNGQQSDAYFRRITSWATATQRAEAFLRTIGKWQEQPQEQTA
jgi:hypothetical protein